jgi:hypothetical protein
VRSTDRRRDHVRRAPDRHHGDDRRNLATAVVVDRFALFGLDRIGITWERVAGVLLLAAGAALTLKK